MAKKKDYFKIFCEISNAFGSSRSKDEVLNLIVDNAIEALDGKAACLYLNDIEKDVFIPVAQKGLSDDYQHESTERKKRQVTKDFKDGFIAIHDATKDPRVSDPDKKKAEGIASILIVPVRVAGNEIGTLILYTGKKREFSKEDVDFLSAMAEQGGQAIEQARLIERIRKSTKLFLDIASNISSSLDIKKILHILSADIGESLGMKGVNIRLLNKDTAALDLVSSYGLSEMFINKGPIVADNNYGKVMGGETIVTKNISRSKDIPYKEALKKEGIVSMVNAPVKSRDEVIGMMSLFSGAERDYTEDMVMLINALAHQGGLAIQNASMFLALQDAKKNLEEDIWSHRMWF